MLFFLLDIACMTFHVNNCNPIFASPPPYILYLRLAAVKRELKIQEMHLQDAARRRLLKLQQDQQEMELKRLDDEIERKVYYLLFLVFLHPLHLVSFKCNEHL